LPSGKGGACGPEGKGIDAGGFQKHADIHNWGFADGHAKAMKYAALWAPGLTPPYPDMWGAWEDDGSGKPDAGQAARGARGNLQDMCLYLR
jgi:hypothetical protein